MIRPAKPSEMSLIKEKIKDFRLDNENLDYSQFVVAELRDEIVGFGRIKPYSEVYELGCLGVLEPYRGKGVGKALVRHLIKNFPADEVYVTTDLPGYFEKLGFERLDHGPKELEEKVCRVCQSKLRENVITMRFKRK